MSVAFFVDVRKDKVFTMKSVSTASLYLLKIELQAFGRQWGADVCVTLFLS